MRLIDAEPILMRWNTEILGRREMYDIVKNAPVVDTVSVVRCKDCKRSDWYTGANGKHLFFCLEHGSSGHSGDDYCSYGEREEDE